MITTEQKLVSVFKNKFDNGLTKEGEPDPKRLPDIDIKEFLEGVKNGVWRKEVERVRAVVDNKAEYDKRKANIPGVTIWGTFIARKAQNADVPSGLMSVDLDHLEESEVQRVFNLLKSDPYVYAAFWSVGGKGLCVIFKVDYQRWLESFEGIRIYMTEQHGLIMGWDASVKDICRLRFVSYDPETYVNYKAQLFKKYPRKEKKEAPKLAYTHTETDIRYVLDQIHARALDLTSSYEDWFRIGWALISQYGEDARGIFHEVSQYHSSYDSNDCDKKFNYLVATRPHSIKIATFYYYCRQAGLDTATPQTKEVQSLAAASKKNKVTLSSALDTVLKMTDIPEAEARPIIEQVYESTEQFDTNESLFSQLDAFFRANYSLRYNEITHFLENHGEPILERKLNLLYIKAAEAFDMKVSKEAVMTYLFSEMVPGFHPIKAFFAANRHVKPTGCIDALAATITDDLGPTNNYKQFFLRKFLVGMVGSVYGSQCPLVPVLLGPPNTGKTQFWRRMLPPELKEYYGESNFNGKEADDEMKMVKKLILMNDEFTGDLLVKHGKFKSLTDKQSFFIRKPYGKSLEDFPRLAMIAGTSNEQHILSDPTGNRRIIPFTVLKIDHAAYNAIDKTELLMEAYHLYMEGERGDLTNEQIAFLEKHTGKFLDLSIERDMVEKYFEVPTKKDEALLLNQGEILVYLQQMTGLKNLRKKIISMEMKNLGFPYSDGEWYAAEKKSKRGFYLYKTPFAA